MILALSVEDGFGEYRAGAVPGAQEQNIVDLAHAFALGTQHLLLLKLSESAPKPGLSP